MSSFEDEPKLLANPLAKQERLNRLRDPHIEPLTRFIERLRTEMGAGFQIPYFDPLDGGIAARVLYLLEAPGAKAVASNFISRNNPDETAKNFFLLNRDAGIPRRATVTWNIVPWYIGNDQRIRAADRQDIKEGVPVLLQLLDLLPALEVIVLIGAAAQRAEPEIQRLRPNLPIFRCPHCSPLFVNRAPGNRDTILAVLRHVREFLDSASTPIGDERTQRRSTMFDSAARLLSQMDRSEKAQVFQWLTQELSGACPGVESTPGVCGGEACIVRTRIPVWLLENARRLGVSEAKLLQDYPGLRAQDIVHAWAYVRANRGGIDTAIATNESL